MALDAEAYARVVRQMFPPGLLWLFESESTLSKFCLAVGDGLARIAQRGEDLIDESDPSTAEETLEDWERVLSLPDEAVVEIPSTVAERRLAIVQKLLKQGGQSIAFFEALAAACGYTVTITNSYSNLILRSGFRCGSRSYGEEWAHVWSMYVHLPAGAALTHTELEAIINRAAPAHTLVIFEYEV